MQRVRDRERLCAWERERESKRWRNNVKEGQGVRGNKRKKN